MALIKCPECGREISDQADACIHCGFPLKTVAKQQTMKCLESHVIGHRGGPGSILALAIFEFVLGIAFIPLGVLCMFYPEMIFFGVLVFMMAALFLFASITTFVKVAINKANKSECLKYDAEDQKLVLYTLYGKEIRINPKDYVELKDNLFTDNQLMFTYRRPDGRRKKVNLGYCLGRDELRSKISKVQESLK